MIHVIQEHFFRAHPQPPAVNLRTCPASRSHSAQATVFPGAFQGQKPLPSEYPTLASSHSRHAHRLLCGQIPAFHPQPNAIGWTHRLALPPLHTD